MPLRFNRRIRLFPGVRLNFSKSGVSTSIGGRGAWFTFGRRGARTSVGLPGTGLSWTEQTKGYSAPRQTGYRWLWWAAIALALAWLRSHGSAP
jgi:hypothetical protein